MTKNGCFNRAPLVEHVEMQDGRMSLLNMQGFAVKRDVYRRVSFRMSRACEYTKSDLGRADKGCEGCKHKQTEEISC